MMTQHKAFRQSMLNVVKHYRLLIDKILTTQLTEQYSKKALMLRSRCSELGKQDDLKLYNMIKHGLSEDFKAFLDIVEGSSLSFYYKRKAHKLYEFLNSLLKEYTVINQLVVQKRLLAARMVLNFSQLICLPDAKIDLKTLFELKQSCRLVFEFGSADQCDKLYSLIRSHSNHTRKTDLLAYYDHCSTHLAQ